MFTRGSTGVFCALSLSVPSAFWSLITRMPGNEHAIHDRAGDWRELLAIRAFADGVHRGDAIFLPRNEGRVGVIRNRYGREQVEGRARALVDLVTVIAAPPLSGTAQVTCTVEPVRVPETAGAPGMAVSGGSNAANIRLPPD